MFSTWVFEKPLPKDLDHLISTYIYTDLLNDDPMCWKLFPVSHRELSQYANDCLVAREVDLKIFEGNIAILPNNTHPIKNIFDDIILLLLKLLPNHNSEKKDLLEKSFHVWTLENFKDGKEMYLNHFREIIHLLDVHKIDLANLDLLSIVNQDLLNTFPEIYQRALLIKLKKDLNTKWWDFHGEKNFPIGRNLSRPSISLLSVMDHHRDILNSSSKIEEDRRFTEILYSLYRRCYIKGHDYGYFFGPLPNFYMKLKALCLKSKSKILNIHHKLLITVGHDFGFMKDSKGDRF